MTESQRVIAIPEVLRDLLSPEEYELLLSSIRKDLSVTIRLNTLRMKKLRFEELMEKHHIPWTHSPFLDYSYSVSVPQDAQKWFIRLRLLGIFYLP
ncbi:MAG TPA: hypothetical protein VJ044_17860 [Candidatus Hodarchaeales archaeon]|nr:hypothetical protein [Candidatus Hodarchaeales archaeon]